MDADAERLLIERARHNSQAFGELFDASYPAILRYTIRRVGDVALAEDIVATTFLKAMQALPKYRYRGVSIEAWFYTIATNEIRGYFRKQRPVLSLDALYEEQGYEPIADYDLAAEAEAAQTKLERHELALQALAQVRQLPLAYQEVLVLRVVEQKKISEIAVILGKREGTIKSLLSRGLSKLRQTLPSPQMQPFPVQRIVDNEGQEYR